MPGPNDSSWDSDDVMPPARQQMDSDSIPSTPAAEKARPQAIDPVVAPSTEARSQLIQSIADENRAITDAGIALRRGDVAAARSIALSVVDQRPRSAAGFELLGDIEAADGDMNAANAAYRRALAIEPGRPTAETKLARAALRQTEDARMNAVGVAYPTDSAGRIGAAGIGAKRNTLMAVAGSLVFPGIGQFVKGDFVKGAATMGATVLAMILLVFGPDVRNLEDHLKQDISSAFDATKAIPGMPQFSALFYLYIVVIIGAWIYSIVDAALPAKADKRP